MPIIQIACETCGKMVNKNPKKMRAKSFCDRQCAAAATRKEDIRLTCQGCGKEFSARPNKRFRKYCSQDCFMQARTGKPVVRSSVVACYHCGKSFKLVPNKIERSEHLYCSQECMGLASRHQVDILPEAIYERYIGKQMSIQSLAAELGVGTWVVKRILNENGVPLRKRGQWGKASWEQAPPERFASASRTGKLNAVKMRANIDPTIGALALQNKNGPTNIERLFMDALDRRQIEYVFQFKVGNKFLCDFYLPNQNCIIECDGIYWHSKPESIRRDKSKDAYLRKCGYKVIRFTDKEIKQDLAHCVDLALST